MNHTFRRGDTMARIAHRYGFRSTAAIWEHPGNAKLREQRPNAHVLVEGDVIFIPEKEPQEFSCGTNERHVFRVPQLTQQLQQVVLDEASRPVADRRYELTVDGRLIAGRTGGDGSVRCELPLEAKRAELKVWFVDGDEGSLHHWRLELGHLEPVETTFGLKSHLANLGYDVGEVNDTLDEATATALKSFQSDHGLTASGRADAATLAQLRRLFEYPTDGTL